ncbi:MAG: hypothetical protein WBD16_08635 [Pyrinomonadaceae bacterium]
MRIFALALVGLITTSCTSGSLVGNWKISQRYDYFYEKWEPVNDDSYIQFGSTGKFKVFGNKELKEGSYLIDETGVPSRLVLTDDQGESVNAIFQLDGNIIIMKAFRNGNQNSQFPVGFDPRGEETGIDLFTLERN